MKNIINPISLKGNEVNERIKQLMGMSTINENNTKSVLELTKIGPDGNAYGIVRENHEYYIKTTTKKGQLMVEDFNYLGGLQNKKSEAYPSYAKAVKHLNLKFNSIASATGNKTPLNLFENDGAKAGGFQQYQGNGFSNEGNMEGNDPIVTEDDEEEIPKNDTDPNDNLVCEDDLELTEDEQAIDDMGKPKKVPVVKESGRLSIAKSLSEMDSIIEGLDKGKKKIYTLK